MESSSHGGNNLGGYGKFRPTSPSRYTTCAPINSAAFAVSTMLFKSFWGIGSVAVIRATAEGLPPSKSRYPVGITSSFVPRSDVTTFTCWPTRYSGFLPRVGSGTRRHRPVELFGKRPRKRTRGLAVYNFNSFTTASAHPFGTVLPPTNRCVTSEGKVLRNDAVPARSNFSGRLKLPVTADFSARHR